MRFISNIYERLQRSPKRIVFPEAEDPRVLQASRQFYLLRLGSPILLGDRTRIKNLADDLGIALHGIRIINPATSPDLEPFCRHFFNLRKDRSVSMEKVRETVVLPNYFGSLLVALNHADGIVSGVSEASDSALRPFFRVIQTTPGRKAASSCMVLELEDSRFGEDGVLFMGDCGVIPSPTREQLAEIAISTAQLARHLTGIHPKVALLSYTTHGDPSVGQVACIQQAVELARRKAAEMDLKADFEGDLQVDAALIPDFAAVKLPRSQVAGTANCLIFPDLNSGNIASKMVRYVSRANAYGQILLGLNHPAADVSRVANAHDILGAAAILGMQAVKYPDLYRGSRDLLPPEPGPAGSPAGSA